MIMLCSNLHCQKVSNLIPFLYQITDDERVEPVAAPDDVEHELGERDLKSKHFEFISLA